LSLGGADINTDHHLRFTAAACGHAADGIQAHQPIEGMLIVRHITSTVMQADDGLVLCVTASADRPVDVTLFGAAWPLI
jgi:hypothetical protein